VSAWVTPLAALAAARTELPPQEPPPLPYLAGGHALDIEVEVVLNGEVVSRPIPPHPPLKRVAGAGKVRKTRRKARPQR